MAAGTGSHGSQLQNCQTIPASSAHSVLGTTSSARSVHVHDFATGPFTTKVKLQFPLVVEKWAFSNFSSYPFNPGIGPLGAGFAHYLGGSKIAGISQVYNMYQLGQIAGFGDNRLLRKNAMPGGYSMLLDLKGAGNPSDFVVNLTSIHQNDGVKFTRTACFDGGDPTCLHSNTIEGDYTLTYATPGNYDPNFVLYCQDYYVMSSPNYTRYNNIYETYTGNGLANYFDARKFYMNVRQQCIPIVKKNSSTGASITAGQTITGMDPVTNTTIVLDKSLSRIPTGGNSTWVVAKQTGSGNYAYATPGVDYTLGGGETLSSNLIHVTWLVGGNFRINCFVADPDGGGGYYQPTAVLNIEFPVNSVTINNITFPTVSAVVTPSSLFTNVVSNLSPLTGIQNLEINVTSAISLGTGSWTQQIDSDPSVAFTLNDADWRAEFASRCSITCKVKIAGTNTVVQQKPGLGPHTFNLIAGDYEVGFSIIPKPPLVTQIATIIDPFIFA